LEAAIGREAIRGPVNGSCRNSTATGVSHSLASANSIQNGRVEVQLPMKHPVHVFLLALVFLLPSLEAAPKKEPQPRSTPYADWIEPGFPFFSSTLDARSDRHALLKDNLTPRGIILNLGEGCWACFDVDLLRLSAAWKGKGITEDALAPKSYHPWGGKTKGGLKAPRPIGSVIAANGIYPGWQVGDSPDLSDPRPPAPDPKEVGRGGLPEQLGRMNAVRLVGRSVVLEYAVAGVSVREHVRAAQGTIERRFQVGPSAKPLVLVLGVQPAARIVASRPAIPRAQGEIIYARVPPHRQRISFRVSYLNDGQEKAPAQGEFPSGPNRTRWPQVGTTKAYLSKSRAAYVVDDIVLPDPNPWRRNVRPGDIQFLSDGTGVVPTLDGDVWLVRGLAGDLDDIRWKRFASGLHEPMTCAIRDDEIFVFDKNGIWKLVDTNGDDEADVHELFSNVFGQTIDLREFPSTIRNAPGGEFVIAKGGQQKTHGKHNGSVLRISRDGRKATLLGYGFRQPAIGVNIRTGLVTSGDQEGQYIPSTPLHEVRDGQFYGYIDDGIHGREKYPAPIAEPITWMPHSVNASAISQVWLFGAKMGPLNDALVHIGFTRPEIFKVMLNDRGPKLQAALCSVTTGFQHPPLNGSVNPVDGQLYVAGFQVRGWGNALQRLAGMSRVRYTGRRVTLPKAVIPMDQGVLLRFGVKLDRQRATNPENYSLATWGYRRSYKYGSPQYKADGTPGIDWHAASSAYVSKDGRSVFVGVPDMKPVMQLRIGWSLATADGEAFEKNAYTTPYWLPPFHPQAEGFGDIEVDLTPRPLTRRQEGPVSFEEGRRLYGLLGCVACHSVNGDTVAKVGPTWMGLFGSERPVVIGRKRARVRADAAYLRESILDPSAKVVQGFEKGEYAMPSYAGVVSDSQIEALILYIKGVKEGDKAAADAAPVAAGSFE